MEDNQLARTPPSRDRVASRMVFGGFLVLIGTLLLLDRVGVELPHRVWSYWPFLLIALGGSKMVLGGRKGVEDGFWLTLAGLYCAISSFGWFGLDWSTAWPLFLVAAGIWIALGSALSRALEGREGSHVR